MYGHCIRSWRSLGPSRHSPLSSLRGFALEPLKVLFVCTRTAAVRSARTAVEGTRWNLGCGSFSTLGFLQRSLVVAFVPWRRIYWRYVVEPRGCCHAVRVPVFWVKPFCLPRWVNSEGVMPHPSTHAGPCHLATLTDTVAATADKSCVGLFERPEECDSNESHNLKQASMSQR